jgi:WD40 repeat protein
MELRPPGTGRERGAVTTKMRDGIAGAVRAGGRLRGLGPSALAAFLAAAAFAPLLVPVTGLALGGAAEGEIAAILSQLGGLGGGYLAALLTRAAERVRRDEADRGGKDRGYGDHGDTASQELVRESLAVAIQLALDAPGEAGAAMRAEVSATLREVGAVQAAMAADRENVLAPGFADLGERLPEFGWVLGDMRTRLAELQATLAGQGARQRHDMRFARGELGAITGLLQRVVAAQEHAAARADAARADAARADAARAGTVPAGGPPAAGPGQPDAGRAVCPYPGMRPFESRDAKWFFGREGLIAHLVDRLAEQVSVEAPLVVFGPSGAGKSSLLRAGLIPALRHGLLPVSGSGRWPRVLVDRPGTQPLATLAAAMAGRGRSPAAPLPALDGDPEVVATALSRLLLERRVPSSRAASDTAPGGPAPGGDRPDGGGSGGGWSGGGGVNGGGSDGKVPDSGGPGGRAAPERFVLVVDQFEEVFTQCTDEAQRLLFIRVLLALARPGGAGPGPGTGGGPAAVARPGAVIVLGVRADFYQDCAGVAELGALLADNLMVVGALAEQDLRRAITRPAATAGYVVEPGLTELLLTDLGLRPDAPGRLPGVPGDLPGASGRQPGTPGRQPGAIAYEPGALPLLGYALRATWDRRAGQVLTVAGYREAGGIHGAVADEAERIYADLPAPAQAVTGRILLRMVSVGPDGQLTRRRVSRSDVLAGLDGGAAEIAVARFTQARLVTADADGVEITHEAFLGAWPRLREWIAEDGAGLRLHRQLGQDAAAWARENRDRGGLYRGARFVAAMQWRSSGDNDAELAGLEREFLDASAAAERAQRVAQEQERLREGRQNRRLRVLAAGLAVVLVAALAAAGVAVGQQRQAARQRSLAESGGFAAQSDNALTTNLSSTDLDALAGWQAGHTAVARSSLLSRQADPYLGSFPEPAGATTTAMTVSPDGRLLAVGIQPSVTDSAHSSVQIWNLAARRKITDFNDLGGEVDALAFSADGTRLMAVVLGAGRLRMWNVTTHRELPDPVHGSGGVSTVAASPVAPILAVGITLPKRLRDGQWRDISADQSVIELLDLVTHRVLHRLTGITGEVLGLAFSPDGRLLASGDLDHAMRLWHVGTGTRGQVFRDKSSAISSVLFSPDGRSLAIATADNSVGVLNMASRKYSLAFDSDGQFSPSMAFSPAEKYLYATDEDGKAVGVWDIGTGARVNPSFSLPASITLLAATPDGATLVGGGTGSLVALDMGGRTLDHGGIYGLTAVAVSRDGRLAATGAGDGTVQLWHPGDPAAAHQLAGDHAQLSTLAFSPDDRLAAAYHDCQTRIWNPGRGGPPAIIRPAPGSVPPRGSAVHRVINSFATFSPDGRTLVTYCSFYRVLTSVGSPSVMVRNTVTVRDAATFKILASFRVPGPAGQATGLAYSPDGHTLAVDTGAGAVLLWDTVSHRVIGKIAARQGQLLSLAFSPDGQLLATAGANSTVRLWHTATRLLAAQIGPETSPVRYLAFSPDGNLLAGASQDATVRLWNVTTGNLAFSLTGYPALLGDQVVPLSVNQVAFGPRRSHLLVSATSFGTAQVWDLSPADQVRRICTALGPKAAAQWQDLRPAPTVPDPCAG